MLATYDVVQSGVDYITLTGLSRRSAFCLSHEAHKIRDQQVSIGNIEKGWGMSGYKGWSIAGVQWGERHDGVIVRLSSDVARLSWWDAYQTADNCSRLDLQVTVRTNRNPTAEVLAQMRAFKRFWGARGDKPKHRIVQDGEGGATFYMGQRTSRFFTRIYNKEVESSEDAYRGCVRYEIEIKDRPAALTLASLVGSGNFHSAVLSSVNQFISDRGCLPRWTINSGETVCVSPEAVSDCEQKLRWLRNQVKPSVQLLIERGYSDEVFDALGLTESARLSDTSKVH